MALWRGGRPTIDRRVALRVLAAGCLAGGAGRGQAGIGREVYALALRQRLEQVAAIHKLRDHEPQSLVAIDFQVDADGRLAWRRIKSGANAGFDALVLRVIDAAAPFRPVPVALKDQVWVWLLLPHMEPSTVMAAVPAR